MVSPSARARLGILAISTVMASCHFGGGPVLGYAFDKGPVVGWEAGGGNAEVFPLLRGNVGQSMLLTGNQLEVVTYVAWEPWAIVGGTFGLAYGPAGFAPALGAWEAVTDVDQVECKGQTDAYPDERVERVGTRKTILSAAFGYRYVGRHELYVTPKLSVVECASFGGLY